MKVLAFISAALSASHLLLVGAETADHFGDASGQVVTATGDLDAVVPRAQKKRFDVIESMGEYNPWEDEEDDDLVALLSEHVEASSTLRKGKKKKKKKKKKKSGKKKDSSDDKDDASGDDKGGGGGGGGDGDDDSECDDDEDPNNNDASNPANPNNGKSGGDDNPSGSGPGSGPGSGGKPKKGGPGGGDGNDPAACAARNAGAPGPPTDMSLGPGSCSDGGAGSGGAANPSGCSKEGQAVRAKKQLFEQRMICDMRKLLQMERDKQKRLAGLQHACKDAELLQKAHKFLKTGIRKMLKGCTPDGSGATSSGSGDASGAGSEGQPAAAHRRENMAQPLVPIQENDPILRKMYEAASDSGLPVGLVDKELASAATAAVEGQNQDPNH